MMSIYNDCIMYMLKEKIMTKVSGESPLIFYENGEPINIEEISEEPGKSLKGNNTLYNGIG